MQHIPDVILLWCLYSDIIILKCFFHFKSNIAVSSNTCRGTCKAGAKLVLRNQSLLIAQGCIFGTKDRKIDPNIPAFLKDRGEEGAWERGARAMEKEYISENIE